MFDIIFECYIYLYLLGDNLSKDYFTCIFLMLFYNIKSGIEVNQFLKFKILYCKKSYTQHTSIKVSRKHKESEYNPSYIHKKIFTEI